MIFELLVIASCSHISPSRDNQCISDFKSIEGSFLVENIMFPQDTLLLNKLILKNKEEKEMLLIKFNKDSLFLSRFGFSPWYGKWFCNFHSAQYLVEKNRLNIHATINSCDSNLGWRNISYQLLFSDSSSFTFVKVKDTSNCPIAIEGYLNSKKIIPNNKGNDIY